MSNGQHLSFNGARLWYKDVGDASQPCVLYLHGGPGHSSYSFERAVGPLLQQRLRMIYFDQRHCGRSREASLPGSDPVKTLIDDIEALRQHLSIHRFNLVGHSFGGNLALEYARAHPSRVDKVILIETLADFPAMLEHQVNHVCTIANQKFADVSLEISTVAQSHLPPLEKLKKMLFFVDHMALQRELYWGSEEAMLKNADIERQSNLFLETSPLVAALESSGYFNVAKNELMTKLDHTAVLFAGSYSQCIGRNNLEKAAATWDIPIKWFSDSGHLPHIEQPAEFADETIRFLTHLGH